MKKISFILVILISLSIIACNKENPKNDAAVPAGTHKIVVKEFQNASGYTYILASEKGKDYWIAIKEMPVQKGDILYFTQSMEMKNFTSKTLNKTFDTILFVDHVTKTPVKEPPKVPNPAISSAHQGVSAEKKENVHITPLKDGLTIEKIYEQRQDLNGKTVKVKGVVTKYNGGIMNRNWIHIQDGTGFENHYDIAVTTDQSARVGETIVVEGVLATDKDFGAGYRYDAIIENAKITTEKKS